MTGPSLGQTRGKSKASSAPSMSVQKLATVASSSQMTATGDCSLTETPPPPRPANSPPCAVHNQLSEFPGFTVGAPPPSG